MEAQTELWAVWIWKCSSWVGTNPTHTEAKHGWNKPLFQSEGVFFLDCSTPIKCWTINKGRIAESDRTWTFSLPRLQGYLFAVEIPNLTSMFIFWLLTKQKLDKCFKTERCGYFQQNPGTGAVPQLFTNHPWQRVNFRAITLIVLHGSSTNNQLLPFLPFQEPSAKSPSRDSRPYSFSSFSPLLCHAVPWNEAKRRGKQWETFNHPGRAQSCASKQQFGDHLAVLGLLMPQCSTLWKDAPRFTRIPEIHCTSFL